MSATTGGRLHSKLHYRLQRYGIEILAIAFSLVLAIWSILPIYNMWMIALDSHDDVFSGAIWPENPTLEAFRVVVTQDFWYLARFWHQFGNSFFVGLMTMFLTLVIGSLASFTVGRMRLRQGWMLSNAALMTYVIPASFLAIPQELYEAAEVDGATGLHRFRHVTVPLMANLYLVCVLLDTIFALGDFNSTFFVSGGGPAMSTEVLATLGIRYAFTTALPRLGVATVMTALPVLIPLVFILMRKLRMKEGQL